MKIKLAHHKLSDFFISTILSLITLYSVYVFNFNKIGFGIFVALPFIFISHYYFFSLLKYNFINKHNSTIMFICDILVLFVIATIITKSFIIYLYPINMGFKAIFYGFGWTLLALSIMYILKNLILKIEWKKQKLSKKSYKIFLLFCLPSIIIFGIMLAIYFPGIGSIDTITTWNSVQNNSYNDNHPIMFLLILKVLSLIWNNIAIVAIFQILLCTVTYGYISYYFYQKGLSKIWCYVIAFILPLIPANTIYSVLLWKDIPYTMGLLIFSIMTIKSVEDNYLDKYINLLKYLMIGLFVLYTRHNALVPIFGTIGFLGLYFLRCKYYKNTLKLIALFLILAISFICTKSVATSNLINNNQNTTVIPSRIPTTIQAQQIIYIEHYYGDAFTKEQLDYFNKFYDAEKVEEHKFTYRMGNSYGPNWMFYHKPYITNRSKEIAKYPNEFWKFYWSLVKDHPVTALDGYQKITAISWASVGYGPTAYRGYSRDEFNIYVNSEYKQMVSPIISWLDKTIFSIYNGIGIIFTRPAFYMMLIFYFCYIGFRKHKYKILFLMCPALLNTFGYLIIIAAQDVRYFFVNYTVAVIAFVYAIMSKDTSNDIV